MSVLGPSSGQYLMPDISVCQRGFAPGNVAGPRLCNLGVVLVDPDDVDLAHAAGSFAKA